MVELGDLCAGEQRKLLLEIEVPAHGGARPRPGLRARAAWVALPTSTSRRSRIPVSVNVVPGDEAAGRVPDPPSAPSSRSSRPSAPSSAAADALRAGDAPRAQMYARAAEALGGYADAELQDEAVVLIDLAERAQHDAVPSAKFSEADRHQKSRRRG